MFIGSSGKDSQKQRASADFWYFYANSHHEIHRDSISFFLLFEPS
jgi:hypothetical protein